MRSFLQFRLWWRRGSQAEKSAALGSALLAVVLAGWALVPAGTSGGDSATTAVAAAEAPASGAAAGAVPGGETATSVAGGAAPVAPVGSVGGVGSATGTGTTPQTAAAGSTAAAGGPSCPSGGGRGVTDKTISIAAPVLDLAGPIGNGAAGVASADELQKMGQAVVDDINARGGVACRKLSVKFYKLNPIGPDQGRSGCLQILQDAPAVVADLGGFAFPQGSYLCIPQQKVPLIGQANLTPSELSQYRGYLASVSSDMATVMRDTAFGLRDRGFFDPAKGFKKLGLLYDQCSPETNKLLDDYLAKAGIGGDKVSKYTFPCPPNGFGNPADMAAAAAQHKRDGVTHVLPLTGSGSFNRYVDAAEGQLFRPKYAVTDYQGVPVTAVSNLKPNPEAFDGAVAMSPGTYGINTTPGATLDAGTKRCQGIIAKAGFGPDYAFYKTGGGVCSVLWGVEAALARAKALTPDQIVPGLLAAGTVQFAFPVADATFRPPAKYYGGDTWAPISWRKGCACWNVDAPRRPSYNS